MQTATRTISLNRAVRDDATRTIQLSMSSETPVRQWDGEEILVHTPDAVDLSRAPLPLIVGHNIASLPVGIVENVRVEGGKLRGVARFGTTAAASEVWQGIVDGTTRNVSVGYRYDPKDIKRGDGDTYRITKWTPHEVSVVAVPADNNVGINRSFKRSNIMSDEISNDLENRDEKQQITRKEKERIMGIQAMGRRINDEEWAKEAVEQGWSYDRARRFAQERLIEDSQKNRLLAPAAFASLHDAENMRRAVDGYSLTAALHAQSTGDWRHAGFEREISQELAHQRGRKTEGIIVPFEALGERILSTGTMNGGGALVPATYMYGGFIDLLRTRCQVLALGATQMNGLMGDVLVPKLTAASSATWLPEHDEIKFTEPEFSQVKLSPKTLGARVLLSRRLLHQSAPGAESIIRNDLASIIGIELDRVAIAGSGVGEQPLGIINSAGIGSVVGGTNGAAPTWQHCVDLVAAVEANNADTATSAFLVNAKTKAKLLATPKATNTAEFCWEYTDSGEGRVAGYRAITSNNVPANLSKGSAVKTCSSMIFGSFSDLIIGMWGPGLEIMTNPYSRFGTGEVEMRVLLDCDVAVRRPESFAIMNDVITG